MEGLCKARTDINLRTSARVIMIGYGPAPSLLSSPRWSRVGSSESSDVGRGGACVSITRALVCTVLSLSSAKWCESRSLYNGP